MTEVTEVNATPTQLPEPKGYRILCAVPEVEDKYEGGIVKADATRKCNSCVVCA